MYRTLLIAAALAATLLMVSNAVAADARHRPWPYSPPFYQGRKVQVWYQYPPDLYHVPRFRYGWFGAQHKHHPTRHRGFNDDLMIWGAGR